MAVKFCGRRTSHESHRDGDDQCLGWHAISPDQGVWGPRTEFALEMMKLNPNQVQELLYTLRLEYADLVLKLQDAEQHIRDLTTLLEEKDG